MPVHIPEYKSSSISNQCLGPSIGKSLLIPAVYVWILFFVSHLYYGSVHCSPGIHRDRLTSLPSIKDFWFVLKDRKKYNSAEVISESGKWMWTMATLVSPAFCSQDISAKSCYQRTRRPSENRPKGYFEPDPLFCAWWMLLATKSAASPSWRTCYQLLGKEMNN